MQDLSILAGSKSPLNILCLGAHSDDIEIGCGGTILKLLEAVNDSRVTWIVFSGSGARGQEAQNSADLFLAGAGEKEVLLHEFRDGFFPYLGYEIKEYFEQLKGEVAPDLIFTHFRADLHQDHRLINELTWNTFRDHLILEYEIPKFDGDFGSPNFFVHLSRGTIEKKAELILKSFPTQHKKAWFTRETFLSLANLRGVESNAPDQAAEGFYSRKLVLR